MENLELLEPLDHLEDLLDHKGHLDHLEDHLDQEDHQVYLELQENVELLDFLEHLAL